MNIVKGLKVISLLAVLALAAACGGNDTCDEVQSYQLATEGQKVIVPSDLDELSPTQEMTIPEPSVQGARPEGSHCLEKPPGIPAKS